MAREDVNIKVSANVAEAIQLWKAMDAGPEAMAKSIDSMSRRGRASTKSMADDIVGMVGKWASVTAVIAGVSKALQEMEENSRRAADAVSGSLGSFGELAQVSGTPEEFRMNVAFARSLVGRGIVPGDQQGLAADITGQFLNVELSPSDMELMAKIAGQRLIKPEGIGDFAESVRKYQLGFGERETGSVRDIVNKLVQAGEVAQVKLPGLASATTQFAGEAADLGISDEEAIAAFLAIESQSPGPEIAATRMRSLLNEITKRGLFRGDLRTTLKDLQGQIGPGGNAFDVLGESRAVAGFLRITNQDGQRIFSEQQSLLQTAAQRDVLSGRLGLIETDPRTSAALRKEEAQGALADQLGMQAERELHFDEFRAQRQADILEVYGPAIGGLTNAAESLFFGGIRRAQLHGLQGSLAPGAPSGPAGAQTNIRLTGPDGRDIPHEVDAVGIQER